MKSDVDSHERILIHGVSYFVLFKIFLLCIAVLVFFVMMPQSQAVVFVLKPDGVAAQNWTSGTFNDINEDVRNDGNYIQSKLLKNGQSDSVSFSLSDGDNPVIDEGHIIRYAFKEDGLGNNSPYLVVRLKQGTTTIASWTESAPLPSTFTQKEYVVSPEKIHQITNYNDLIVEFEAICETTPPSSCTNDNADRDSVSVSWMQFQYETTTTPRAHPPPTITGIGFYNVTSADTKTYTQSNNAVESGFKYDKSSADSKNAKDQKSGAFFGSDESIPTFFGQVNHHIQLQIQLQGVFASTKIEHLSLISGAKNSRSEFTSTNFEIIADKGKKPIIIDPNKIFKTVESSYLLKDGYLWVYFDLTFQKPLTKSNLVIQSWDEQRIPVYLEIPDAWEISDPTLIPTQKEIATRTIVRIGESSSLSSCDLGSCFDPVKSEIRKGGIVTWVNDDIVLHTVISGDPQNGPDGRFNFAMPPGKIYEKIFDTLGTYKYYCSLHPWNTGIIYVSNNISTTHVKYPFLNVFSKSIGKTITNNQTLILVNHDLSAILSGAIPEIKKPINITIIIKKPDKSTEKLSLTTNQDGKYHVPIILSKKWQDGTYQITLVYQKQEVSSISFAVSDKG